MKEPLVIKKTPDLIYLTIS